MLLPLSDDPNPRGIPWMNNAILATNVAIYFLVSLPLSLTPADPTSWVFREYVEVLRRQLGHRVPMEAILSQVTAYDLFVYLHGFKPAAPEFSDLLASMFLHANFLHLFGNMLFLWIYGDNVEHRLGHFRYLLWYVLTGMAASLFHAFFFHSSMLPLVGASGAISGVLGFYFRWFPYNRVRLLLLLFPFFMNVVYLPARWVLGFYLIVDNILPFLITYGGEGSGVAFGAHIGGFLAGMAAATWFDRRELGSASREAQRLIPARQVRRADAASVADAIRTGDMEEAAGEFFHLDAKELRKLAPQDAFTLGQWLAAHDSARSALAVFLRLLQHHPDAPEAPAAHLAAAELLLYRLEEPTLAYQHIVEALRRTTDDAIVARARTMLRDIARQQKFQIGRPRGARRPEE